MTKMLLEQRDQWDDIAVVFANTGQEHEETLRFIHNCDEVFGFGTVWIEAVVNEGRTGTTHKVVDYASASRGGSPFEGHIQKYGIPNRSWPHCTRELKKRPTDSYIRSLGWSDFRVAIGIRADEVDRMRSDRKLIYPMICWGWTREMVNAEVGKWPFDLEIPNDAHGNCVWCWKKSDRKLMTLARTNPEYFDFPRKMERKYRNVGTEPNADRRFFRGNRTVDDIIEASKQPFDLYQDNPQVSIWTQLDQGGGCGDSCEIYADEEVA